MATTECRVCGGKIESILSYSNMPKAAQFLPDAEEIKVERGADLDICQCAGCGLVQLSNDPVHYYKEVVRAAAFSEEMRGFRVEQFQEFVSEQKLQGRKVLETGCGKGEYLSLLKESGALPHGIEFAQDSVDYCQRTGLDVNCDFIDNAQQSLQDGPFDAFMILNFLEHVPDPKALLRGIANNLTEDGCGMVEVPNFDMIIKNNLFSEFINDHLFYFTKDTLTTLLELCGFEVVECKTVWYDYILSATVRKRQPLDLTHFYELQKRLETELKSYIDQFEKVAIWGAGHQALAVVSMTGIEKQIEFVVDSADFKQGKFTPASHLPIVAPARLSHSGIEAIIVMAASYSDEVAKIIKRDYSALKVAILRDYGLEVVS